MANVCELNTGHVAAQNIIFLTQTVSALAAGNIRVCGGKWGIIRTFFILSFYSFRTFRCCLISLSFTFTHSYLILSFTLYTYYRHCSWIVHPSSTHLSIPLHTSLYSLQLSTAPISFSALHSICGCIYRHLTKPHTITSPQCTARRSHLFSPHPGLEIARKGITTG